MLDTVSSAAMELRLFGICEARLDGKPLPPLPHRKDLWLLALLALRAGQEAPRDWLAVTLWPDAEESRGLYNLRRSLSHLRHALGAQAGRLVSPTPRTVRLDLTDACVDTLAFERACAPDASEEALEQAVALYRGPLLADCREEWVLPERNAREQAYLEALERLAGQIMAKGEPAATVRPLRLLTAADPYRESAYAALMQALAHSGDRAALGQVYHSLRALLRRDLNTDPAPETQALYERLSAQSAQSVPLPDAVPTGRAAGRHLPVPLTDLIGRQAEIEEVVGWLGQARLVTLLGPGGVGKTRLAIGAAEAALPQFGDGAWFVDLAPLTEAGRVADTTARALGVTEESGHRLEERLTATIGGRSLLLVLDNCEHMAEACASLVQMLLASCSGLRVLATSRQPLGLTGEQAFRVPSLAMPPERATGEKDRAFLLEYAAVRLFVERARQVSLSFRLTPQTVAATADLCRRLDGIPLAIELAAARMRSLTMGELHARLDDRFRLLTGGSRSARPRQQTLRALVDWSYDLLTEPEKTLLARLSVFAGGWTLEAAEAVCSGEGIADFETLDLLTALTDKSLAVAEARGERTRYGLLETIRDYAAERLALGVGGPPDTVRLRRRDWFLALAEAGADAGFGPEARQWLDRLEADHDNLRTVLDDCLEEDGADAAETALRLTAALAWFWAARGFLSEGRMWMERALAQPEGSLRSRAKVLVRAATLAFHQADTTAAQDFAAQALALSEGLGDQSGEAHSHLVLGQIAHLRNDHAEAQAHWERSLTLFRALDSPAQIGWSLHHLGLIARQRGDLPGARALLEEALGIGRALGYILLSATALNNLAWVRQEQDDLSGARALSAEALVLMQNLEERSRAHTLTLLHLGGIALQEAGLAQAQGQTTDAQRHLRESCEHLAEGLRLARAGGHRESGLTFLEFWSFAWLMQGHPAQAARVLGAAQALRAALGVQPAPGSGAGAAIYAEFVSGSPLKAVMGEAAFAAASAEGERFSWEQAVAYVLQNADG